MADQASWSQNWKKRNDAGMVPDRGFTKQLKCLCPTYEVIWDMTVECATAAQNIGGGIMVDSSEVAGTLTTIDATTANTEYNMCGNAIVALDIDEILTLCVSNNTATNAVIVDNAHVTLKRIK